MNKKFVTNRLKYLDKSQKDLADKLNIDPAAVHYLLNGKRQLKAKEVVPLANFLKVYPADILNNLGA